MKLLTWDKTIIQTASGPRKGIAPIIISASRATDIPALHAEWFRNRLQSGYVKWINPFNRAEQYVSFEQARVFVFWTKNARPFFTVLNDLDALDIGYYFQHTLNDYELEGWEPGVPPLSHRIETFQELSSRIGKERIIWRFDPLIATDHLCIDTLLDKIAGIARRLKGYTNKLIVSLVDIEQYRSVKRRMNDSGVNWRHFSNEEKQTLALRLLELGSEYGMSVAACCEGMELQRYGLEQSACIDSLLIRQLYSSDKLVRALLGLNTEQSLFGEDVSFDLQEIKDKGQRQECGCMISKDIGSYDTCWHNCLYCYANHGSLRSISRKSNQFSESLQLEG